MRRLDAWLLVAMALCLTRPAAAKLCGDAVNGADVPCACGDVVVSNLVLGNDPVLDTVCPNDGLVIRAPDSPRELTIDLHGRTLRGSGQGVALRVIDGGTGGARVVSSGGPAHLDGFEDGVIARGVDSLQLLEDVVVGAPHRDGVRVTANDVVIHRVEVRDAGRDGFALGGRGFEIAGTQALNSHRFGYFVMGESGQIGINSAGNVADHSGDAGFNVMGIGHVLLNCTARDGGKAGLQLQAAQLDVRACQAHDNAGGGIVGIGNGWRLLGNLAEDNGGDGITVRGQRLADAGGNRGARNGGDGIGRPAVQCVIGGTPCAL